MAKHLNRRRLHYSKLSILSCVIAVVFSKPLLPYEMPFHAALEYVGYFLVAACVLGRVYCSAFIGGYKNARLITYGPFSVTRNPLYLFSLIGVLGLALTSGHLLVAVVLLGVFALMYRFLILREERFLLAQLGPEYRAYMERTPRLIPKFSLYDCPDEITVRPQFIAKACLDAIWWFVAFPVFELIEYLQEAGIIPFLNGF